MPNNTEFRLAKKSCFCPVLISNSQRRNPSLFSGSSNNPSFLTTNSFIYSSLSNKHTRSSSWINTKQVVNNTCNRPLSNKLI